MSTLKEKIFISTFAGLIAAIVNSNYSYKLTKQSRIVHTLVYLFITFITMPNLRTNTLVKFKNSLYGTLILFFIFSPELNDLFNNPSGNKKIIIQTILYVISLVGVMYLP